ncbi:MAG: hypothetical protein CV045_10950 [Cyanobacteria bacterium M5B4]|nr:MAG: hypothetical protein CV045_10950 [Cyanobacteria bacterium M5B4]
MKDRVKEGVDNGIEPSQIAIIARRWDLLDKERALLEKKAGIPTNALQGKEISLVRNLVTQLLLQELESSPDTILPSDKSVKSRFEEFFIKIKRDLAEPTVKRLIKIAEIIDTERGYGNENLAQPIVTSEIITSIYEFNDNPEHSIDPDAVVVTTCHSVKGLEFKHVILLADGFSHQSHEIEQERRLFYVAMTRAKEKLLLTYTRPSKFVTETDPNNYPVENNIGIIPPQLIFYYDMTPKDVYLGFEATKSSQDIIMKLKEGDLIDLRATLKDNWKVCYNNQIIGLLSRKAVTDLTGKNINTNSFKFKPGEVTVRNIYRHIESNEITGEITDEWYVVIPRISVCR